MELVFMYIEAMNERVIEKWQHSRFLAWITLLPDIAPADRKTIFEFLPMPGDPSKEEQEKMKQDAIDREYKELKEQVDEGTAIVRMMQEHELKKLKVVK